MDSPSPLSALAGEAHLYLAAPADWMGADRRDRSLAVLSCDERRRHERFRVAAPARSFATGRALARQVLSLYDPTRPADWHLEPDDHGRPRILGRAPGALDFNLSHNDRLVACLVTGGAAGGVDVESLDRRVDPLRIAEHSFREEELEDLAGRTGSARRRRFFAYWTLKEAYLKARGRGIEMRLDSILLRFPPGGTLEADFAARTGDRAADWQFALFRAAGDQLVAVAVRREGTSDHTIRVFRATPDDLKGAVSYEPLAASSPATRVAG